MDIAVIGAGSVGLGIASCLLTGGHRVILAGRPDTCQELRTHGLVRTGIFGEHRGL